MNEFFQGVNGLYVLFTLAAMVGAFFAGRRGYREKSDAAVDRLNETLGEEIKVLRRRLGDIEQDRDRQDRILAAIRYALRQYKLRIVVNHEFVTIIEDNGVRHTASIKDTGKIAPLSHPEDENDNDAV